jgi:hypothetical protein
VRIDGQHIFQADDALIFIVYHATQPKPSLLVALVGSEHSFEQVTGLFAAPGFGFHNRLI